MQRTLLLVACLLISLAHPNGTQAASAQAQSPVGLDETPMDTLTINLLEAHRRALAENPDFLSEHRGIEIAQGQLKQAQVFALNPEVEFRAPGIGSSGTIGEFEAVLSQEIEVAGRRGLRVRAASFGLERTQAEVEDAARRMLAEVSNAFFRALAAQERLVVVTELGALGQQLLEVTQIQVREGEISIMEANLAEIEAGRARARMLAERREAASARLALQQLIGISPDQDIRLDANRADVPGPTTFDPDSLILLALAQRSDLVARSRAVEEYDVLAGLARREAIPNPRIGLFVEREERFSNVSGPGGPAIQLESPRIGLRVSLPIPLFQRNQGVVAEQVARTARAQYDYQATELAVRTQVVRAVRAYESASAEVRIFEQEVLPSARANQQLLDAAFQAGKVALPTLLLLRNQLLDAELSYWDAWLAERRALVELQSATATLGNEPTLASIGELR